MNPNQALLMATLKRRKRLPRLPRFAYPDRVERDFRRELTAMIRLIRREVERQLIGRLPALADDFYRMRPDLVRQDATDDELDIIIEGISVKVAEEYSDEQIARIAQRKGIEVAQFNEEVLIKGFRRVVGVDLWFAQPWLAQEIKIFTAANTKLITSLRDDSIERVRTQVLAAFRAGKRWEVLRNEILSDINPEIGNVKARANLIARDQISKLNGQLTMLRQAELGLGRYVWRTSLDERVRATHRALEGRIFRWDKPPDVGHPGWDYQCLISGTKVDFATPITEAFKRFYTGPVVKITCETGVSITVTPNHPILTARGWVCANDLEPSDELLECLNSKMTRVLNQNVNYRSVTCDDVFDFLKIGFSSDWVTGANVQFHGDGIVDEKVEIISVPRSLPDDLKPSFDQHMTEFIFSNANFAKRSQPTESDLTDMVMRVFPALGCQMSFDDLSFSLVGSHLPPFQRLRFRRRSNPHSGFDQSCAYDVSAGIKSLGNRILAESSGIHCDNGVYVELLTVPGSLTLYKTARISALSHSDYSGYVFNFSSDSGMYIANGFAVSNCRCVAEPYLEDLIGTGYETEAMKESPAYTVEGNVVEAGKPERS